jgi:hypothetical protein
MWLVKFKRLAIATVGVGTASITGMPTGTGRTGTRTTGHTGPITTSLIIRPITGRIIRRTTHRTTTADMADITGGTIAAAVSRLVSASS